MEVIAIFAGKAKDVWQDFDAWYQAELARQINKEQARIMNGKYDTCYYCGHTGPFVNSFGYHHIGGQGEVRFPCCGDAKACIARREIKP